jgi:hypothetical protein
MIYYAAAQSPLVLTLTGSLSRLSCLSRLSLAQMCFRLLPLFADFNPLVKMGPGSVLQPSLVSGVPPCPPPPGGQCVLTVIGIAT